MHLSWQFAVRFKAVFLYLDSAVHPKHPLRAERFWIFGQRFCERFDSSGRATDTVPAEDLLLLKFPHDCGAWWSDGTSAFSYAVLRTFVELGQEPSISVESLPGMIKYLLATNIDDSMVPIRHMIIAEISVRLGVGVVASVLDEDSNQVNGSMAVIGMLETVTREFADRMRGRRASMYSVFAESDGWVDAVRFQWLGWGQSDSPALVDQSDLLALARKHGVLL